MALNDILMMAQNPVWQALICVTCTALLMVMFHKRSEGLVMTAAAAYLVLMGVNWTLGVFYAGNFLWYALLNLLVMSVVYVAMLLLIWLGIRYFKTSLPFEELGHELSILQLGYYYPLGLLLVGIVNALWKYILL